MTETKLMAFDKYLYIEECVAFKEFLEKGVKRLDDMDLITIHTFLARSEHTLDMQHRFLRQVEDELLFRLNQKRGR
jgi:hypothetical protein